MAKKKKVEIPERKVVWHIQDDGSVSPIIQNQKQDIAPVQTKQSGFFKSSDAKNNWSIETDNPFMNVVQRANATLWGTILDAGTNVVRGATSSVEGIGDFAQNRVADVQDLFGHSKAAEKTRRKSEQVWGINQKIDDFDSIMNTTSVLGDKSDSVFQGVGTSLFAMGTGALGGAIGGTNAAASILSLGTMGLGASGNAENQARQEMMADLKKYGFNTKQINNASRMYGLLSGVGETLSEMMFGGISQTSKVLGIGSGVFDSADDAVINALTKKLKTGIFKNFVQAGLKASGEGVEEIASGFLDAAAKKLTYMKDEDFGKLLKDEKLLDSFISGTLSATLTQLPSYAKSVGLTPSRSFKAYSNNEIRDFVSNLNTQEQQVVEREIENRLAQEENPTNRKRMQIEKQVIEDLDRGYISANTIRETLGENYNPERDLRLNESFNEETRRSQAYENDLSKYDEKQRKTIQTAIDSGLLNNSNKTHDFVDLIAKLSADKGIDFDFTNNENIKNTGFAIDGKQVNGFIQDGKVTLNLESNQALNKTVGHEITHVLEGTDLYNSLQDSLKSFIGEREWNNRISELEKTYKGVKGANIENELTSDLVGEYVFNDESFVRNLSTKNPNLFQKIFDEIKYMVKIATAGSKEARDLEKVKRAFEKAYRETSKTQEGTQYAIKSTQDGTKYVESNNLKLEGELTEKNVYDILKGTEYTFEDGDSAYIVGWLKSNNKDVKSKNMYNELFKRYPKYFNNIEDVRDFNTLVNYNTDELLKTSKKTQSEIEDINQRHKDWNIESFDTRQSILYDNKNDKAYIIDFSIANMENGDKIAYAKKYAEANDEILGKIKADNRVETTQLSASDDNISQNNDNVKYSITQDSNGNEELTLYHGTSLNAAFKIQKYGFVPNSAIGADGGAANYNYFTNSRINAETYRDRKDRYSGQLLRVKKTADMQIDDRIVGHKKGEYDFRTQRNVTPDEIQILTEDGYWTPISNYDLYTDTPADQKVIDKSLLYDDDGNKVDDTSFSLEQRVSGDKLLDAQDLIEEVKNVGAEVDDNGYVTVYHQTTNENAQKIRESGEMYSNEPYVFFSTSRDAQQSQGRGETKLEFKIPAEDLILDDLFSDNADVKVDLKGNKSLDVSKYLVDRVSLEQQLENQGTRIALEAESKRQAMIDNFQEYLDEYDITNPTQQDIDNSLIDLLGYDNDEMADNAKNEQLYNKYVREYMEENNIPFNETKYSLTDNQGRQLSEQQQEYFKDSKVRDEEGRLLEVYHGSPNEFTVFDKNKMKTGATLYASSGDGFYFTDSQTKADKYSKGGTKYSTYLNITNPFVVENNISNEAANVLTEFSQRVIENHPEATQKDIGAYELFDRNDIGQRSGTAILSNVVTEYGDEFTEFLKENGYDGIKSSVTDYDNVGEQYNYVAFESNQIKNVDNTNPTSNPDIRYQLGNNEVAPTSGWNVRSEDVRLQSAFQDTIAPLQEQVQQLNDTITRLEDRIAPLNDQEADELYQETQRGFENEIAPTRENLTQEENQRLDMLDLLERNNMLTDEQRYEREQLQSKENPINLEQEVTPGQALSDVRDTKDIGSPKVKAYQYEHPEVKPYFQEEARRMLSDLDNTTSGGRYVTERTDSMYGDWHGIKRFTSPEIAALLDGEYGAKYQKEDIRKGLNAIIEDHGAENIAVAKRIELVLDERLRNGYDAWGVLDENGEQYHVAPNSEYLNMLAEQEWQNYFDDIANQYPIDDNQVQYALEQERQQEEQYKIDKSLEEMTADDINLEPFLEGLQGARERQAERQQQREEINQKKEVKIPKQSNGRRAVNRGLGLLVNEFAVLDDYSKQTKNKDIKFKTDTYNNYQAIAQSNIETAQTDINGKRIGRSGNSIFEEAKRYGLADTFDEYLKQWANVDRAKQGKGAANFSAKESYKIVKEMEAKNPRLKKLGADMWQYYRNARHNLRDAGIISQEVSDMLGRMYPHYTPYISENIENYFVKDGELKPKATIKRAKGGAAIGSLLSAEEAMQRYTKSEFNTIFGNDLFKEIVNTSNDIVQLGGDDRGMQFVNADNLYADKNGYYLTAYENGNPITAKISEDMYRTLTRESRNRISDIENTFSAVTKPLQAASNIRRNILTSWSPTFMAKNFIKDFQEGIFNSKYTKDFIKNYPSAFKELATNTELAQQFKSLYGSGLTMGQYDIDANNYNPSGKNKNFLKGIKNVNELIELAPRYAEFKASIDHGASIQEAMYNAREVTTNFSRGGTLAKALNRNGFTFLNSSIQGFDKFIRNFSGENGAKGIVNSLAKAAIFGIAPAVFNELAFGSGDDKDEEYEALPDYIKDNYYIIKLGKNQGEYDDNGNIIKIGGSTFLRIPKGRVFSVFGSAARRTIEAMEGEENAFEGYWNNVQQQIGINNPEENNIFAPLIQAMGGRKLDSGQTAGEAWYGGDIIPSRLQKERPEDQYDASIDKFSIWLGQKTGISPYKINYVLDQYSGGIGDIGLPMITDEANSDGSIIAPIKDQFTADTITDNKYVSEFYDTKNKLYTGSKATDEDILKSKYMNDISKQMGELYAERREIQADTTLTKKEKYEKAQAIKSEINRLAKEGLDNYEKAGITGDYANTNGQEYQKTEDGWRKLNENTSDELNLLGLTSREKNNYIKTKQNISSIKEKYKDSDDYNGKKNEIIGEIINTNLDDNSKLSLYQDTYRDKLANSIDDLGINADTYLEYKAQDFSADKDKNGKSISGSKKRKVFDYINSLDIPYQQKLILAKSEYNSFNDNNAEIIEYIENSGMDYSERIELYKNLGFKVDGDNISW